MAANEEQSHLLRLPRELRNAIYSHLGVERVITLHHNGPIPTPSILLQYAPNASLLRTCKQIHAEYRKTWTENLRLCVTIRDGVDVGLRRVTFLDSFPTQCLQKVKECIVMVEFRALWSSLWKDDISGFVRANADMTAAEVARMVAELAHMLRHLSHWRRPDANVTVGILVDDNAHAIETTRTRFLFQPPIFTGLEDANTIEKYVRRHLLQPHLFAGLENAQAQQNGKLRLRFLAQPPVHSLLRYPYGVPPGTGHQSALSLERQDTRAVGSKAQLTWLLKPLSKVWKEGDEDSFCGFEATVMGSDFAGRSFVA